MFFRYFPAVTSIWFIALLWFSSEGGMSVPDVLLLGYTWLPLLIAWIVGVALARRHNRKDGRAGAAAQRMQLNSKQPTQVGLFFVRETETTNGGTVPLITAECMFDDCGLVFSSGRPRVIGEDSYDHLIGNWWHWWRSW